MLGAWLMVMLVYWYLINAASNVQMFITDYQKLPPQHIDFIMVVFDLIEYVPITLNQLLHFKEQSHCVLITAVHFTSMNLIKTVTYIPEGILCLCSMTGIVSAETEKKKNITLNIKSWLAFIEIRIYILSE